MCCVKSKDSNMSNNDITVYQTLPVRIITTCLIGSVYDAV